MLFKSRSIDHLKELFIHVISPQKAPDMHEPKVLSVISE